MYIDTVTGQYPLSADDIKAKHPDTLFSAPFTPPPGFAEVSQTPHPAWNPVIETLSEGMPELKSGGWVRTWVIHKTYSTPEQEAAAIAKDAAAKKIEWRKTARVTAADGRKKLARLGKLQAVDAFFNATDNDNKIDWEYATEWERNSGIALAMLPVVGGDEKLDEVFGG